MAKGSKSLSKQFDKLIEAVQVRDPDIPVATLEKMSIKELGELCARLDAEAERPSDKPFFAWLSRRTEVCGGISAELCA